MISKKLERCIKDHALQDYPNECVGYISNGEYTKLNNVSNKPCENYKLSPTDKLLLYTLGNKLEALVHSHPELDNIPSELDTLASKSTGFTFYIIGTDGETTTTIRKVVHE